MSNTCGRLSESLLNCLTDLRGEKSKFIADAFRLADDISNNHTFNTVKPLLNFWAAFTPSNEVCTTVCGQACVAELSIRVV